jgi:sugar transferase (PEP-CTERM system associated)
MQCKLLNIKKINWSNNEYTMPAWSLNRTIRTPLLMLCMVELLVLYSSVYLAAYIVCGSVELCEAKYGSLLPKASVFAVIMVLSLVSTGLYQFHQRIYYHEALVRVVVGVALGAGALFVVFNLLPWSGVMKTLGIVAIAISLLMLLLIRYFFLRNVDENVFRHRTLVVGAGSRAAAISELRRKADRRGFKLVGSVPTRGDSEVNGTNAPMYADREIEKLAHELGADEIVIAMDERRGNLPIRELLNCRLSGIEVIDIVEFLERETGKIRIDLVNPGWLIFSSGFRISRFRRVSKRIVDLLVGLTVGVVALPIAIVVVLAIKLEDGLSASVLYRQVRVGYQGRDFDVLKFRSMREDAEADGQAVWAKEDDDRVTRVGRWLRKLRLDEIPQIMNVIRGEMSIVGPRPERPEFVRELSEQIPYYSERHTVLPGVTGWAQIQYPYGSSTHDAAEKLQYDLYYVKNHNVFLDVMIILQTVEVILWGKGSR